MIELKVYGVPIPQGSKTPVKNKQGRIVGSRESNDKTLRPWRQELADAARAARAVHGHCLDGPLELDVIFRFPMPKSARAADRARGWAPKSTIPDSDKLVRAVGDAMKAGGLIVDDARFADVRARKIDVWQAWTGAVIRLGEVVDLGRFRETAVQLPLGIDSLEPGHADG